MKVLLLGITVGEGVKKICSAISSRLNEEGIENKIIDVYADDPKSTKRNKDNYYKLVKYFPRITRSIQHNLSYYNKKKVFKKPNLIKTDVNALYNKLENFCNGYDVVFTPTVFVAYTLQKLKQDGKINCKIIYCIPDFNVPVCTELLTEIDAIITPCEEVKTFLSRAGLKNLYNYGCPVDKKFLTKLDRNELCKKLKIENRYTILYMCGGIGFGNTSKVIKKLHSKCDAQYIIVNGKNQTEKDKIDKWIEQENIKGIINYGFCTNMEELMSVSDIIVSKTGMATMTETAAKGLVLANIKQPLYPEYDNMLHLLKHDAGIFMPNYNSLAKVLNEKNFELKQKNFQKLFNADADKKIVNLIKEL